MEMTKIYVKSEALKLREAGHSYNYISQIVRVSKSTLSLWLADIPYIPNQETIERIGKARAASGQVKSKIKRESIAAARKEAEKELGNISRRDLFMLGLGLYIGEGAKSTQTICIANSNPAVIVLMVRWLTKIFGLSQKNLRLCIHIYPDCDQEKSLQYWSKMTNIPISQFRKTSIDRRTDKKVNKEGKLPYGTAHLIVNSLGNKRFGVFLSRKIGAFSDKVLKLKNNAGVV